MIVELERPSKFKPVKLAAADDSDFKRARWRPRWGGGKCRDERELFRVDVPLVSDETCAAYATVDSTMVCAGGVANLDSCDGDLGSTDGEDVLVGVVSGQRTSRAGVKATTVFTLECQVPGTGSTRSWAAVARVSRRLTNDTQYILLILDDEARGVPLLRLLLHVCAALLLTSRSSQLGSALHPFQRAVANDWVRLLFYVDVAKQIAPDERRSRRCPISCLRWRRRSRPTSTMNSSPEASRRGLRRCQSARSSPLRRRVSICMGLYATISNCRMWRWTPAVTASAADGALRHGRGPSRLPLQHHKPSASEQWPAALRMGSEAARQQETRKFFDELDAMELKLVVGMKRKEKWTGRDGGEVVPVDGGHALRSAESRSLGGDDELRPYSCTAAGGGGYATGASRHKCMFNWVTLMVVVLYQVSCSRVLVEVGGCEDDCCSTSGLFSRVNKHPIALALRKGAAKDFWFWFVLTVNFATVTCFVGYVASRLSTLVNTRFHISTHLAARFTRVMQFLVGVLPIFVGFVLFGTVMFGAKVPRFQSASSTATTLFSVANGDEIHDTFNDVAYTPWIGQIYVYSYMILFSYVVLMVCIGIIEDAFFSAVFPASWPRSMKHSTKANGLREQDITIPIGALK
ncbi:Polycystin cation channel, PKD1/PKD2 [Phytophthora cactorum]|nr:Polycystin cation channel, PKD1/PKD2 [Phytophthora cactorum]